MDDAVAVALELAADTAAAARRSGGRASARSCAAYGARSRCLARSRAAHAEMRAQRALQRRVGIIAADVGLADALAAAPAGRARPSLSCRRRMKLERPRRRRCRGARDRQPGALEQRAHAGATSPRLEPPQPLRQSRRDQHPDADRLAVQPLAVARGGLDRVAEGVAEIQQRALALLALVARRRSRP